MHLDDKIPEGVHTLFVGINPAIESARRNHYFAHPSNHFWRLIRDAGLHDGPGLPCDDDLVKQGFGFTDIAKRPTVGAKDVTTAELLAGPKRIEAILDQFKPRIVAIVSKTAARAWLGTSASEALAYGPAHMHGATQVWFLPSTSGQSFADGTYAQKLHEFQRLTHAIRSPHLAELRLDACICSSPDHGQGKCGRPTKSGALFCPACNKGGTPAPVLKVNLPPEAA